MQCLVLIPCELVFFNLSLPLGKKKRLICNIFIALEFNKTKE